MQYCCSSLPPNPVCGRPPHRSSPPAPAPLRPQVPALSPRQLKLMAQASLDKDASASAATAAGMIQASRARDAPTVPFWHPGHSGRPTGGAS